jgi:hypothetical protein
LIAVGRMAFGLAKLVAAVAMWKFQEWGGYLLAATVTLLLPFDLRQALSTPLGAMSCWPWRTPPGWSYWCSLCEGGCLVGHSSPDSTADRCCLSGCAAHSDPSAINCIDAWRVPACTHTVFDNCARHNG